MSKETVEEVKVISPGAILKAAREKQGLSREKVAEQLHLRFTIIKQLEEDQYASDISATFTKGYLKLYAKLLGIDEKPVLSAYQKLGTQVKEPAKLQSFSQKVARQASDQRLMWVTYLVLVLIVAGVIGWWIQQDDTSLSRFIDNNVSIPMDRDDSTDSANTNTSDSRLPSNDMPNNNQTGPSATSSPATELSAAENRTEGSKKRLVDNGEEQVNRAPSDEPSSQASSQSSSATKSVPNNTSTQVTTASTTASSEPVSAAIDSSALSQTPDAVSVVVTENNSAIATLPAGTDEVAVQPANTDADQGNNSASTAAETTEAATNLPLATPVELVFTFSGDCWMKLTDATGEDVAYGVKLSGRVMPVSGVPPFEVVLGAPESVQISYASTPVDMARFRPGYTARFQLPLSE